MNFKNLFKIALNALLRNKFRAFLTMLGIIIGIASVIAVLGIGEGSKLSIQQQIAGMGLNLVTVVPGSQQRGGVQFGASTMQSLKERDLDAILSDCPAVIAATPEVRGNGQAVYGALNFLLGPGNRPRFDQRYPLWPNSSMIRGPMLQTPVR